jgi:hypothetical protein
VDKKTLANECKISLSAVNAIITAMGWQDSSEEDYTVYLPIIQAIKNFKDQGARSWVEATSQYQLPMRRERLQGIVESRNLPADYLEQILDGCELKLETLTEEDIEFFEEICVNIHSGQPLRETLEAAQRDRISGAITIPGYTNVINQVLLPEEAKNSIETTADALALELCNGFPEAIVHQAVLISQQIDVVASEAILKAVVNRGIILDEQTVVEKFKQRRKNNGAA